MLYHVDFCAVPHDPVPPLSELASIEADDPVQAARLLIGAGRVPQDRMLRWARVVLAVHPSGRARQVLRLSVDELIPTK